MEHLAIDLGGKESQICVRTATGQILEERRCPTAALPGYLASRPRSRVIVETCSEAFLVADAAATAGHEVRVVPATLVRQLGVGARGVKSDQRDAQVLSEVSCRIDLPSVHVPSARAREWKTLSGMREGLVQARTQLINTVRGWLRGTGQRVRSGDASTFADRVRTLPTPCPSYVARQLDAIAALTVAVADAERDLRRQVRDEPLLQRLTTIPGIGPTTAIRFVAALDDVHRFRGAHAVAAYLGLVPGEHSSGARQRRTGITKAGPRAVRWCFVQAAWAARRRRRRDGLQTWVDAIEHRRGTPIAILALARKLAGIAYAVWRDGTVYRPIAGAC